jgi:predicted nicotinamide N-methyase
VAVQGRTLSLAAPENPYALLESPAVAEAFAADDYMPYWAHLWPAAMMLGQWLLRHVDDPRLGREAGLPPPPARAMEIGCGLGVPALLAAKAGYCVTAGDYDADAMNYVQANAQCNGLRLRAVQMDWRRPPPERYPLILGADVLYERRSHAPILELLRLCLETVGLAALADPNRSAADPFLFDAPAAGWTVRTEPVQWEGSSGRIILLRRR